MQTQKQTVKNKILKSALEEFIVMGYQNASMRNIATSSGITVGNIYSYFSGKDDLFDNVLEDTVDDLNMLINLEIRNKSVSDNENIFDLAHKISEVFQKNRMQFLILMDKSEGSKYENIKSDLIKQASVRIIQESKNTSDKEIDNILAESIAVSVINGLINLFKRVGKDNTRLEKLIGEFLMMIF